MKRMFFLFLMAIAGVSLMAQDPVKDMKKAARLLGTYNLDPAAGADKLAEAVTLANASINDPAVKADPTAWQSYGDIFMAVVNADVAKFVLDPGATITDPSAPHKAFKGYTMAAKLADKSYQTKDAMKGLSNGIQNVYFMGSALYQSGEYKAAFEAFTATYDAFSLIEKNNEQSNFDPNDHSKALFYSGLCAQQAGMMDEARLAFEQLINNFETATGPDKTLKVGPQGGCYYTNQNGNKVYVDRSLCDGTASEDIVAVYETLFTLYRDVYKDTIKAEMTLESGRKRFPEDKGLLYSEINHLLAKGELVSLISKLEKAIELEPNNISVFVTIGQIYDKLFQDQVDADPAGAEVNFEKAMSYYHQALVKDPKSFDAVYSIGALWYNKAAAFSKELNELSNDYSPAGTKKYDAKKVEMDAAFAKALPFFQQAEEINPTDFNTLIALKEIYARQDKFDLVEIYKNKITALGNQ